MKNTRLLLVGFAAVLGLFSASLAIAEPRAQLSQSARSDGSVKMGIGLSTSSLGLTTTSFTGIFDIGSGNSIQAFLGVASVSPFQFGVGGALKHEMVRHGNAGLHLGGGVGVGNATSSSALATAIAASFSSSSPLTNSPFGAVVSALAGIHVAVPGAEALVVHLDGGATLTVAGGATFGMQALSPALGISIFYML